MLQELDPKITTIYKVMTQSYIKERMSVDECFRRKCETVNKSVMGVVRYIQSEATKLNTEHEMAMWIPDDTVHNWICHYINEDSLNFENTPSKYESKKASASADKKDTIPTPTPTLACEVQQLAFDF